MRTRTTLPKLAPYAHRTVEYRSARSHDALRQIADASVADLWGRAVEVLLTTNPAEAPLDCQEGFHDAP